MSAPKTVKCPTCGKIVPWNNTSHWRPFCSDRCRLIDLGEWADEKHSIAGSAAGEFTEPDPDDSIH